jgi:hydroxymethylpyrimidine/phosphomethylpyrimidine kinase
VFCSRQFVIRTLPASRATVQVFPYGFFAPRWHMSTHSTTQTASPENVVLVGGLDPGAGAGIARDLLTAHALGARAFLVGTAWTVQGASATHAIEPRDPGCVHGALAAALAEAGPGSGVKIGMVANARIAQAIVSALVGHPGPVVYDPVLRTSRGGSLYEGGREEILALAQRATLFTPNLAEAGWLLGRDVRTAADARESARAIHALGIPAVLVKGGHLEGEATDVLRSVSGERWLSGPRIPGPSPRGTGCALATAIAIALVRGQALDVAAATAKAWLAKRISQAVDVGGEYHLG